MCVGLGGRVMDDMHRFHILSCIKMVSHALAPLHTTSKLTFLERGELGKAADRAQTANRQMMLSCSKSLFGTFIPIKALPVMISRFPACLRSATSEKPF